MPAEDGELLAEAPTARKMAKTITAQMALAVNGSISRLQEVTPRRQLPALTPSWETLRVAGNFQQISHWSV